ncbi:hypothetical protein M8J77_003524 [Diaphorina citri]|nr:hypothetical protein M8J77_003524 [Diaphorina citri]
MVLIILAFFSDSRTPGRSPSGLDGSDKLRNSNLDSSSSESIDGDLVSTKSPSLLGSHHPIMSQDVLSHHDLFNINNSSPDIKMTPNLISSLSDIKTSMASPYDTSAMMSQSHHDPTSLLHDYHPL